MVWNSPRIKSYHGWALQDGNRGPRCIMAPQPKPAQSVEAYFYEGSPPNDDYQFWRGLGVRLLSKTPGCLRGGMKHCSRLQEPSEHRADSLYLLGGHLVLASQPC